MAEPAASPTSRPTALAAAERALVGANRAAMVALVAAMAVLVFANVVSRYVFNHSIIWAEELSRYMMIWVGFVGSGLVLRYGAHIAVDIFQDLLPARAAQALRALVVAILAITFATLTWLGVQYVSFAWGQETPVLNWNFGLIYLAIPLGALLMLLHLLLVAAPYVRAREFVKDKDFNSQDATL